MTEDQTTMAIMAQTIDCKGIADFEQRCRTAMSQVAKCDFWMVFDRGAKGQDMHFRGALAAVMLAPETTEEEKTKMAETMRQFRNIGGLLSGMPMDLEAMLKDQEENPPLPLLKWWHEEREKVATK